MTATTVLPRSVTKVTKDAKHLRGRERIQASGRLVGENDRRVVGQRPCHGDALPLSAGQLVGSFVTMIAKPERGQQFLGACAGDARRQSAQRAHRQCDILGDAEFRQAENETGRRIRCGLSRTSARSSSVMRVVERPSIRTSPAVGRSSNPRRYSRDDFPEPDGPVMAMNSRGMIARLISCTRE